MKLLYKVYDIKITELIVICGQEKLLFKFVRSDHFREVPRSLRTKFSAGINQFIFFDFSAVIPASK